MAALHTQHDFLSPNVIASKYWLQHAVCFTYAGVLTCSQLSPGRCGTFESQHLVTGVLSCLSDTWGLLITYVHYPKSITNTLHKKVRKISVSWADADLASIAPMFWLSSDLDPSPCCIQQLMILTPNPIVACTVSGQYTAHCKGQSRGVTVDTSTGQLRALFDPLVY